jgi:hypothetical protein
MPTVRFRFVNATATNLPLLNYNPGAGWGPVPPAVLDAHTPVHDAVLNNTESNVTLSYGVVGAAHNALYLHNGPTVDTTPNMHSQVAAGAGGNYTVTLTYL